LAKFDAEYGRPKWQPSGGKTPWKPKPKLSPTQILGGQPAALKEKRERRVLGAILEWPELMESVDQTLFGLNFQTTAYQQLQKSLLSYWEHTISVDKQALRAHIEADGLAKTLNTFKRERNLTIAALGGKDANLKDRIKLWVIEARALDDSDSEIQLRKETRGRMADTIRSENTDGLHRLMRTNRAERD
jgi:DNA primase